MAGTIIVSNLKTDTDNSFIVRSNTGATLFSCNTSGLDVANTIPAGSITASKLAVGAALPSQTGSGTYYLTTDGTNASWKAQTALTIANTQLTGTLIASQIAAVNATTATSGTLPKARLPAGSILQVLSVTDTAQYTFNSGSAGQYTYYDVSGLSLSITPTSSSSKILILAEICASQTSDSYNAFFRASRNSTAIGIGINGAWGGTSTSAIRTHNGSEIGTVSINFLDSPATTSATTYKVEICNSGGSGSPSYVNRPAINTGWEQTGASTLTIMEIAA